MKTDGCVIFVVNVLKSKIKMFKSKLKIYQIFVRDATNRQICRTNVEREEASSTYHTAKTHFPFSVKDAMQPNRPNAIMSAPLTVCRMALVSSGDTP